MGKPAKVFFDDDAYAKLLGKLAAGGIPDQLLRMLECAVFEAIGRDELDSSITLRDGVPVAVNIPGVLRMEVDPEFATRARHYCI
jgi:hypothetical protein